MSTRVGQQFGNYRLLRLLGSGSFGEVYLGEHDLLATEAAIKVLLDQLTSQDKQQFHDEARTIAHLIHPHIVRLLEFGVESNTPFMVMDYAPNGTLRDRHPKGTQLSLITIVSYVAQIADALQYAHDAKLIHRDIKPENMLVGRRNEILLSDFGIAVVAQSTHSLNTLNVGGTVLYMAPEQIQGKARPASDQYALGVIVYEWLCGECPFKGTASEIAIQHMSTPPPSLLGKVPLLPPDVEQVVMTALAKDPKQRFASVQDFAAALEQASQTQVTVCTKCGNPLRPGKKFCGTCGTPSSSVMSTIAAQPVSTWNSLSTPTLASTLTPTSPLSVPNPTEEDVTEALNSKPNPYAPWGKLVLDETVKRNFSLTKGFFSTPVPEFKYVGEVACLEGKYNEIMCCPAKGLTYRNFAFQVEVTLLDQAQAGIFFRSNSKHTQYYYFSFNTYGSYTLQFINERDSILIAKVVKFDKLEYTRSGLGLMAVVAQDHILDIYVNLQHLKRVEDYSRSDGQIGFATGNLKETYRGTARFRRAKIWIP